MITEEEEEEEEEENIHNFQTEIYPDLVLYQAEQYG